MSARPGPLSGFPEYLPADRIVEQHVLDTVRRVFELHGFASIETRAAEPLEQILDEAPDRGIAARHLHRRDDRLGGRVGEIPVALDARADKLLDTGGPEGRGHLLWLSANIDWVITKMGFLFLKQFLHTDFTYLIYFIQKNVAIRRY